MSESTVSRFFERLDADAELAGAYTTAVSEALRGAVWPAIAEVAAKEGFAFSTEELGAWLAERQEELGEEALEGVTGGARMAGRPSSGSFWVPAAIAGIVLVGAATDTDRDERRTAISP